MTFKNIRSWLIIILLSLPVCLWTYWSFIPVDVIDVTKVDLVDGYVYHRGDYVTVDLHFNKFIDEVPITISRTMVKQDEPHLGMKVMVIAATNPITFPKGNKQEARMSFIIPVTAPLGHYKLVNNTIYRVNPIRDFPEYWESPPFELVAK